MEDYEKLGAFYLGKVYDMKAQKTKDDLLLYDSKDLTTHAVCVGMTGSGKTGLCIGLIEEAAIDGVPAILIDPKGDLGNLLLTFPDCKALISFPGSIRMKPATRICRPKHMPTNKLPYGQKDWGLGAGWSAHSTLARFR